MATEQGARQVNIPPELAERITAFQQADHRPSFTNAAETLIRKGLDVADIAANIAAARAARHAETGR